ncbi:MAG: archaellar assembly protein FlaJ [Halobacteriaceae archaeon]
MSGAEANRAGGLADLNLSETVAAIFAAYDQLGISRRRYLLAVVLPALAAVPVSVVLALVLPFPLVVRLPVVLLGLLVAVTAVIYPKLRVEQRRNRMENHLHLLITHMTVLSTTNIDRMEVFRTLAEEEEYGELAREMRRISELVDTWNQSLDDACRIRANRVPSQPVADLLDRLSYSLGAGQGIKNFLLSEQEVVIENYVTVYESALNNLEVMKDLYLSMVLSMTFALVFAIVLPILTGTDPFMTVAGVIVLYVFVQTGFAFAIRTVSPDDPVWFHPDERGDETTRRITAALVVGGVLAAVLAVLSAGDVLGVSPGPSALWPGSFPLPLYAAVPVTPLVLPGILVRREEQAIVGRDEQFPSFIRALGASESAKQSTSSAVLEDLRRKDFGTLTDNVDDLYKRLNMRIATSNAWRYFAVEARSYLIQKFSEMYLVGRQMGGDPQELGELISENMSEVLQLRERRRQATITLIGLLYGISAASTFAFFIGLQVVNILASMSLDLSSATGGLGVGKLIHTGVYNIPLIEGLLVGVILFNAGLSALMIRNVDGGNPLAGLLHFVGLTWLGAVVAVLTKWLTSLILQI